MPSPIEDLINGAFRHGSGSVEGPSGFLLSAWHSLGSDFTTEEFMRFLTALAGTVTEAEEGFIKHVAGEGPLPDEPGSIGLVMICRREEAKALRFIVQTLNKRLEATNELVNRLLTAAAAPPYAPPPLFPIEAAAFELALAGAAAEKKAA